jgi:hypothetical protein
MGPRRTLTGAFSAALSSASPKRLDGTNVGSTRFPGEIFSAWLLTENGVRKPKVQDSESVAKGDVGALAVKDSGKMSSSQISHGLSPTLS